MNSGGNYSRTVKGKGRVNAGFFAQLLYGGKRKYGILITLIIAWFIVGPPFGLLGMGLNMSPIYGIDPLSGKSLLDRLSVGGEDKTAWYALIGWIGTIIVSVLIVAFVVGWIITARRYKFVGAEEPTLAENVVRKKK